MSFILSNSNSNNNNNNNNNSGKKSGKTEKLVVIEENSGSSSSRNIESEAILATAVESAGDMQDNSNYTMRNRNNNSSSSNKSNNSNNSSGKSELVFRNYSGPLFTAASATPLPSVAEYTKSLATGRNAADESDPVGKRMTPEPRIGGSDTANSNPGGNSTLSSSIFKFTLPPTIPTAASPAGASAMPVSSSPESVRPTLPSISTTLPPLLNINVSAVKFAGIAGDQLHNIINDPTRINNSNLTPVNTNANINNTSNNNSTNNTPPSSLTGSNSGEIDGDHIKREPLSEEEAKKEQAAADKKRSRKRVKDMDPDELAARREKNRVAAERHRKRVERRQCELYARNNELTRELQLLRDQNMLLFQDNRSSLQHIQQLEAHFQELCYLCVKLLTDSHLINSSGLLPPHLADHQPFLNKIHAISLQQQQKQQQQQQMSLHTLFPTTRPTGLPISIAQTTPLMDVSALSAAAAAVAGNPFFSMPLQIPPHSTYPSALTQSPMHQHPTMSLFPHMYSTTTSSTSNTTPTTVTGTPPAIQSILNSAAPPTAPATQSQQSSVNNSTSIFGNNNNNSQLSPRS